MHHRAFWCRRCGWAAEGRGPWGEAHGSQAQSRLSQQWRAPEGARCRSSSALLSSSATTLSRNSSIPCGALPSILACCPGMVTSQPSRPPHSYANSSTKYKYYELAVASRQIAREGRSRPALPRKPRFPYEWVDSGGSVAGARRSHPSWSTMHGVIIPHAIEQKP